MATDHRRRPGNGIPRCGGFTMVELAVVVLIVGLLVAIAVPAYHRAVNNATESTCRSNLRAIDGAVARWVADDPARRRPQDVTWEDLVPAYLKERPACPAGGAYTFDPADGRAVCPNGHRYGP
ncbi:MAG: prepilin-type N-terminal cleavage/methylation domain-containing protein [Bacillota bacterium]|nr:prepilin-type N-terminal cleavage/methylation domain-containing protein [Bacillota bacterium]